MKFCALLLTLAAVSYALPADIYKTEWMQFKNTYKKLYASVEEETLRFNTFKQNLDKIVEHNLLYAEGKTTFSMGVNQFTDMTADEMEHGLLKSEATLPSDVYETEWKHFKETYRKLYASDEEETFRFNIFKQNLHEILQHNQQFKEGKTTFTMGVNQFTDMTANEMEHGLLKSGATLQSDVYETEWKHFKETYRKLYASDEEETLRFKIFKQNLDEIIEHNQQFKEGKTTFTMGVNQFTDMNADEMEHGLLRSEASLPSDVYETEWKHFKETYRKLYASDEEENFRFNIFKQNLDEILEHNHQFKDGKTTFTMGVNQFTDMTPEEMEHGLLATVAALPIDVYETEWKHFKETYKKLYASEEEETLRFNIFKQNLDKIVDHNQQFKEGKTTFTMGVNKFTDMTPEEMEHGLLTTAAALPTNVYETEWKHFKETYKKLYASEEEETLRFNIFKQNLHKIVEHNQQFREGKTTFTMGVNKFTDMTSDEMEHGLLKNEAALTPDVYDAEWKHFKDTYKKLYATKEEEIRRSEIFCNNLKYIKLNNELYEKGVVTSRMGVNQFADMTHEEFIYWVEHQG